MIITCPDCGKNISDQALSCPDCGRPIHIVTPPAQAELTRPVQTIELTSKKYKSQLIVAFILLFISGCLSTIFLLEIVSIYSKSGIPEFLSSPENQYFLLIALLALFSLMSSLFSLLWIALTRFLIWWEHR